MAQAGETIRNPRTAQTMTFRQTAADTGGHLLQLDCSSVPRGPREPEHLHPHQESRFAVRSGALRVRIGATEQVVGPGQVAVIPPRTPHTFWVEGDAPAQYRQEFRPALRSELFFETLFGLAREGRLDARGLPALLQLAVLMRAFSAEIRPTRPPWPLLWLLAVILSPLAHWRGYRAVYPRFSSTAASPVAATTGRLGSQHRPMGNR
jgi:mannose-6-phosphate isomerase-like protein (cupin superfamily)